MTGILFHRNDRTVTTMRTHVLVLSVSALAATGSTQASWTQLSPGIMPPGRTGAAYASDGSGLLVFGGVDPSGFQVNDLWRYDGANWTNLTPATGSPAGRWRHAGAWDQIRQRFVVFGGGLTNAGSSRVNETWEWNGVQWMQMTPANSPSARWWHAMAYDLRNARVLLFGGQDSGGRLNDTWAWDGTNWTQLAPTNVPPMRERAAIANNIVTGDILLFGGNPGGGTQLGDTWLWDGSDWQPITTATIPYGNGLRNAGMSYDLVRDRYVLYGGVNPTYTNIGTGNTLTNTWEFDGIDWVDRGASPLPHRSFPNMAFVLSLGRTILFSGFAGSAGTFHMDTWEYQTNALASYTSVAGGCAGTAGTPALIAANRPWVGTTLTVNIGSLGPTAAPFMITGLSSTTFSGGSLPFPLAAFGAPQCSLVASPDVATFVPNQGGTAAWSLALPNNAGLIGLAFFNQCIALESGLGVLTISASGRGDAVIGAL